LESEVIGVFEPLNRLSKLDRANGGLRPLEWCNSWPLILETGVGHQYVLQRWLVFRVSGRWWRDLARFWSVYLVALGINLVALPLLVEIVHLSVLPAQTIVMLGVALGTFVAHRSFSLRRPGGTIATKYSPDNRFSLRR